MCGFPSLSVGGPYQRWQAWSQAEAKPLIRALWLYNLFAGSCRFSLRMVRSGPESARPTELLNQPGVSSQIL